jgi:hypothetical protein
MPFLLSESSQFQVLQPEIRNLKTRSRHYKLFSDHLLSCNMKVTLLTTLSFLMLNAVEVAADGAAGNLRPLPSLFEEVIEAAAGTSSPSQGTVDVQIEVKGLVTEPTEKRSPTMSECWVKAYGAKLGYKMKAFHPTKEVDVDKDDNDSADTLGLNRRRRPRRTYEWARADWYECGIGCPNDDDELEYSDLNASSFLEALLTHPSAAEMHDQFEHDYCDCLQKSGLKTFKGAHECDINYIYDFGLEAKDTADVPFLV